MRSVIFFVLLINSNIVSAQLAKFPADVDLAQGEKIYNSACGICHQQGIADSPKLDDFKAWLPRLDAGFKQLVDHSINGFKAMPPKGGRMDLADEQIRDAVGYMVAAVTDQLDSQSASEAMPKQPLRSAPKPASEPPAKITIEQRAPTNAPKRPGIGLVEIQAPTNNETTDDATTLANTLEIGTAYGTLTVNDQTSELRHAIAYRAIGKHGNSDKIVVILSDHPLPNSAFADSANARKTGFIRFLATSSVNSLWLYFTDDLQPKTYDLHHRALARRANNQPITDMLWPYLYDQAAGSRGDAYRSQTTADLDQTTLTGNTADQTKAFDDAWQFRVSFNAPLSAQSALVEQAAAELTQTLPINTTQGSLAINSDKIVLQHALAFPEAKRDSSTNAPTRTTVLLSPEQIEPELLFATGFDPLRFSQRFGQSHLWLYLDHDPIGGRDSFSIYHPPLGRFSKSGTTAETIAAVTDVLTQGQVLADKTSFGDTLRFNLVFKTSVLDHSSLIRSVVDERTQGLKVTQALGQLIVNDQAIELRHSHAFYRSEVSGDSELVLLLSEQPITDKTETQMLFNREAGVIVTLPNPLLDSPYASTQQGSGTIFFQVAHPDLRSSISSSTHSAYSLWLPNTDNALVGIVSAPKDQFFNDIWELKAAFHAQVSVQNNE